MTKSEHVRIMKGHRMKIKRKEYNRLKAIANARIRFDSPTGPILDMTMTEMYYTGLMREMDETWWYHGPMRWTIVTERATLPSASTTPTPVTDREEM